MMPRREKLYTPRAFIPNGRAQIAREKYWPKPKPGAAPEEVFTEVEACITRKMIYTQGWSYSRMTGQWKAPKSVKAHTKGRRCAAYRFSGKEWITIPNPEAR